MEGWIKWLGEIVWRATQWPAGIRGDEREENFWYRMYGVGSLAFSLAYGLWWVSNVPEPLSKLITLAVTYPGADRLLAQGYIGVGLILVFGIPVVVIGVFSLATIVTLCIGLGLVLLKGIPMFIAWLRTRRLASQQLQPTSFHCSPPQRSPAGNSSGSEAAPVITM